MDEIFIEFTGYKKIQIHFGCDRFIVPLCCMCACISVYMCISIKRLIESPEKKKVAMEYNGWKRMRHNLTFRKESHLTAIDINIDTDTFYILFLYTQRTFSSYCLYAISTTFVVRMCSTTTTMRFLQDKIMFSISSGKYKIDYK